jgi:hypothetical protein
MIYRLAAAEASIPLSAFFVPLRPKPQFRLDLIWSDVSLTSENGQITLTSRRSE